MSSKTKKQRPSTHASKKRVAHEAEGAASGALAGAIVGAAAGPPGVVAGALLGGVAGGIAGAALDADASEKAARTRALDAQIGVDGGDLGAPNLKHPAAKTGAYSPASAGAASSSDAETADGPISPPRE